MSIEKPRPQLNKNDILKAFGDRVLMEEKEKVERMYLDLDTDLSFQVSQDIADKYRATTLADCLQPSFKGLPKEKPLFVKLLKGEPNPVSLIISKVIRAKKEEDVKESNSEYVLKVVKGDFDGKSDQEIADASGDFDKVRKEFENNIAFFRLCPQSKEFTIIHRFVDPHNRGPQNKNGDRISNILLDACEQIVRNSALSENRFKELKIDTGQLDVMAWLYNNGYDFNSPISETNFNRIQNADKDLRVVDDLYVIEQEKLPDSDKDYDKRRESLRIGFRKEFYPDDIHQSQEQAVNNVRNQVHSL